MQTFINIISSKRNNVFLVATAFFTLALFIVPAGIAHAGSDMLDYYSYSDSYTPDYYSYSDSYTPSYYSYSDSYTPSYYSYSDSYTPSYDYTPSYSYTPSYDYTPTYYSGATYVPYTSGCSSCSSCSSCGGSNKTNIKNTYNYDYNYSNNNNSYSSSSYNYVYTNNNNNNNNTYNYATTSSLVYVPNVPYYPPVNNTVSAYCVANQTNAAVGQTITWTVYANGYNNNNYGYSYNWSGTDSLYGSGQTIGMNYSYPGIKYAYVTVYANGQSIQATCSTNVQGNAVASNVTVIRQPGTGTPVSGVYLDQVPATGIEWNYKTSLFLVGLLIWSAFAAYLYVARRKSQFALATVGGTVSDGSISREEAFKLANMNKKGILA